jgi:germacradienol/geosmin synthase
MQIPSASSLGLKRFRSFLHPLYRAVGPTPLPEFYLPYPLRLNPHLGSAREHLMTWGSQMGMLGPAPGVPGGALWTEHDLRTFDFALCAAGIDPDADPVGLDIASSWLCWGTYGDDYYPLVFGRGRNLAGAKAQNRRLVMFMPVDSAVIPAPVNPIERGLADLWARTTPAMTAGQQREFRDGVAVVLDAWVWELAGEIAHQVPDPVDYTECAVTPSAHR